MPNFIHHYKFWFYFRKCMFQVFLPVLLAFMSFCDFINQSGKEYSYSYNHLYFYTSLILFLYGAMRYVLDFIFSICSVDVIFKKEIGLNETTNFSISDISEISNEHFIVVIKKIFKLRYSKLSFFKNINKLCWFLGINGPILIPYEIITKLGNVKNILTEENEDLFLHTTLTNLYTYHPQKFNLVRMPEEQIPQTDDIIHENLIPKILITQTDKMIGEMQKELFNKEADIGSPNV